MATVVAPESVFAFAPVSPARVDSPSAMADAPESVLLRQLLREEPAAWREVVAKYSGLLLAISRRTFLTHGFLPSSQDCEDAVAEVWRNLLADKRRVIRRCLEHGHFLATLQVLARNRTVDTLRRRRIVAVPLNEELVGEAPVEEPSVPTGEWERHLPKALAILSARERRLIELFFLRGKRYREIEGLTGIPQNSIGPTLGRALIKLRKALHEIAGPDA
jgi:RNA polymerase sigma-70 factor, ECF subfamily